MMRWDVINAVASAIGAERYLEIGVDGGTCLERVCVREKWGVDPNPSPNAVQRASHFRASTSDAFFANPPDVRFDLAFIDGLHEHAQVLRDVLGSLSLGAKVVVLHDCNPTTELMQIVPMAHGIWTGDCWKTVAKLRSEGHALRVVDTDYGVGVLVAGTVAESFTLPRPLRWDDLVADRARLLGLMSLSEWEQWLSETLKKVS